MSVKLRVDEREGLWFVSVDATTRTRAHVDDTADPTLVYIPPRVLAVQHDLERGLHIARVCAAARSVRTDDYTEHLYWETVMLALARFERTEE